MMEKEDNISGEKKQLVTASDFARKYVSDSVFVKEKELRSAATVGCMKVLGINRAVLRILSWSSLQRTQ